MTSQKIVLHFPRKIVNQPVIWTLIKEYDLECSILKANITPSEEGLMVLELKGNNDNYKLGIDFLTELGLKIQPLSQDIIRNKERCIDCGVCIPVCPAGALEADPETRKVSFNDSKCVVCEFCVQVCPFKAMEVRFE
ncbi:MAG: 4Fe-4S binding protein [Spirochaetota bacterium]|nr:MAG: 4Fe-4S binding protein [Spirochaetota bacterium]